MSRRRWPTRTPASVAGDLIVSLTIFGLGLLVWVTSRGLPPDPVTGEHPGPAGVLLMLAGLGMTAWAVLRR